MSRAFRPRIHLAAIAALAALACSHPGGPLASHGASDAITTADIRASSYTNVYDLIAQLRYRWLQSRGPDSINMQPGDVRVRIDDNDVGTVQVLRNVSPIDITSIFFVDGVSAAGRRGLGYAHGAVVISTRPPKPTS